MSRRDRTLLQCLERLQQSRATHPQSSSIGNSEVGKLFLEKLEERLKVTDELNDMSRLSFAPSIKSYIESNGIMPHAQKLYDNRFWIYINHFCRVYEGLFMGKNYYDLEYIKDSETSEINPLTSEVLDVIGAIIKNRLNIKPLEKPIIERIAFHGSPLTETFTVPKNLIICYSTPITNISKGGNDEIFKIYEYIANNYNDYWATPDIINSNKHITKYLNFYYPDQQIFDIEIGKPTLTDFEGDFGYFEYNSESKKLIKTQKNSEFFKKLDGAKLSEYCKDKIGILFVDTCRACNLDSSLGSADVELMCIYEPILKTLNNIISEIIFKFYKKTDEQYIDNELSKIQQPKKGKILSKKQQTEESTMSKIVYDMIKMTENHVPFFDPFLSVDYDIPSTKRKLFSSKFPLLPLDDATRKASNLDLIKKRIDNIPIDKLFTASQITRDHILSILLDAISFHNNDNIVKYLCDLMVTQDNMHLIDKIINKSENITYYLFLNSEYRKYAIYLLVWYYDNKKMHDVLDDDSYYYLKVLNEISLDVNDIRYTLDIKNKTGEWDMFFRVLIYNLIQYISDKTEPDKSYNIYFQNVINISKLITDILSADIKRNIIKAFGLTRFSDFFEKLSQNVLVKNYNDYITKQKTEMLSTIHSKGGKKIIYKTFKNKHASKYERKIKSTNKK